MMFDGKLVGDIVGGGGGVGLVGFWVVGCVGLGWVVEQWRPAFFWTQARSCLSLQHPFLFGPGRGTASASGLASLVRKEWKRVGLRFKGLLSGRLRVGLWAWGWFGVGLGWVWGWFRVGLGFGLGLGLAQGRFFWGLGLFLVHAPGPFWHIRAVCPTPLRALLPNEKHACSTEPVHHCAHACQMISTRIQLSPCTAHMPANDKHTGLPNDRHSGSTEPSHHCT